MNNKAGKTVLIVDDEPRMCEIVKDAFLDCNERADFPYRFEVEASDSAADCVQKAREKTFDIIVLDVRMEDETAGVKVALALALAEEFGPEMPVRIVFTGFPSYRQCVSVLRSGAWDYIVKEDVGEKPMSQIVVDSAVTRLQQLDLRREQEQRIAADWFPRHFRNLQKLHGGKVIALWHEPKVSVIANGSDAFELEANLREWRRKHPDWHQPFIVAIPPEEGDGC